jgi:hypothetical protein
MPSGLVLLAAAPQPKPMKSFRLLIALATSFVLLTGISFAADPKAEPQKPACACQQADKDGKKSETAKCACGKDGKTCECGKKAEKKEEKK